MKADGVPQATVEVGHIFAQGGFLGLVIYAALLAFFLLLVRDFLKDYLIRSIQREQTATNREVAAALMSVAVQMSQMHSSLGMGEYHRMRDRGELPSGVIK